MNKSIVAIKFEISEIQCCFPHDVKQELKDWGVLEKYKYKEFSFEAIRNIISELNVEYPYIENSMSLYITVMWNYDDDCGYHQIIDFVNYEYSNQKRSDLEIKFLTDNNTQ